MKHTGKTYLLPKIHSRARNLYAINNLRCYIRLHSTSQQATSCAPNSPSNYTQPPKLTTVYLQIQESQR
ncbi:hypothetical protein BP00DRAFT_425868 [Aspergillus indologenus CBS 114.80]|uniref:Uncharacterized protein n=1 Tax=Aspergillus indologenus CBS 114.80 TaxID=1450541 RepID=A0A2V5J8N0_9EURO|nr:hypothetical protein BP00DRAFT_425868 [Aspergillus indologenus CBS 114.80]